MSEACAWQGLGAGREVPLQGAEGGQVLQILVGTSVYEATVRGFVQKRNQIGPKCERIVKGSLGRKDKGTAGVGAWPQGAWPQGRGRRVLDQRRAPAAGGRWR